MTAPFPGKEWLSLLHRPLQNSSMKRKLDDDDTIGNTEPPPKQPKLSSEPSSSELVLLQLRVPITNPVRSFKPDSVASLRSNIDIAHGTRFFGQNPEIVVVEASIALMKLNTPLAEGTFAVWFAEGNEMNSSGILPSGIERMSQPAELFASTLALRTLRAQYEQHPSVLPSYVSTIVLRVPSRYLPTSMDGPIQKWLQNGWKNAKGLPVPYVPMLKELLAECIHFEQTLCLAVEFWYAKGDEVGEGTKITRRLLGEKKSTIDPGRMPTDPKEKPEVENGESHSALRNARRLRKDKSKREKDALKLERN